VGGTPQRTDCRDSDLYKCGPRRNLCVSHPTLGSCLRTGEGFTHRSTVYQIRSETSWRFTRNGLAPFSIEYVAAISVISKNRDRPVLNEQTKQCHTKESTRTSHATGTQPSSGPLPARNQHKRGLPSQSAQSLAGKRRLSRVLVRSVTARNSAGTGPTFYCPTCGVRDKDALSRPAMKAVLPLLNRMLA
jgi:hypothetical protein